MNLFIDTADVAEIREAAGWGILDGVTTNPSLVAKEGRDFYEVVREICSIVTGPVSAEVVSVTTAEMIKEGRDLMRRIGAPNVVVKNTRTGEGRRAITA